MAQRWSLKEDFIIANFCEESDYLYMSENRLDKLMECLDSEGFVGRSRRAVSTRANWYMDLHWKGESPYAVQQVFDVAEMFNFEMKEMRFALKRTIAETYEQSDLVIETIAEAKAYHNRYKRRRNFW